MPYKAREERGLAAEGNVPAIQQVLRLRLRMTNQNKTKKEARAIAGLFLFLDIGGCLLLVIDEAPDAVDAACFAEDHQRLQQRW